ncbi:hypothetical protein NE237_005919 [Protea cynaroides]|uniref:RNase H type-1 domain-containing protein n=1 Tax=Protea cynaroides TaxID=273540 RepID=A0A9Q0QUN8_9MAGN|nr:hypothetical protein NE237_005919 [Protea cynaroides]
MEGTVAPRFWRSFHSVSKTSWTLWSIRNELYFENKHVDPMETIRRAEHAFWEYQQHSVEQSEGNTVLVSADSAMNSWAPPPPGYFKLNTDAAMNLHTKQCGIGFVLRNGSGQSLLVVSQPTFFSTPVIGEALALRVAIFEVLSESWFS